jgi:hypothetical protein
MNAKNFVHGLTSRQLYLLTISLNINLNRFNLSKKSCHHAQI